MDKGKNSDRQKVGVCKLTGLHGPFVKAHILPLALTRPAVPGAPLYQYQSGRKLVRRWSSWYDMKLVTAQGERILEKLDDWAIKQLRRHKLVWSGWRGAKALCAEEFSTFPRTPWGIRKVCGIDSARLRLFFLSIIWRAAASTLPEFGEVTLPANGLEQLRAMVARGDPQPLDFLPISLTQLSTIGPPHNLGVFKQDKQIPGLPGFPAKSVPIIRIYLDGLIAHAALSGISASEAQGLGPQLLGVGNDVLLNTVTFEESFQHSNMLWIEVESV